MILFFLLFYYYQKIILPLNTFMIYASDMGISVLIEENMYNYLYN